MTDVVTRYKVVTVESEAGWGQSYETDYYETEEQAKGVVERINAHNTAPSAPAWYMRAEYHGKVEGVMIKKMSGHVFRELKEMQ
jgi:hypothetical protein